MASPSPPLALLRTEWKDVLWEACDAALVSMEGRDSSSARSVELLPFESFEVVRFFQLDHTNKIARELAFLNRLHSEILSSAVLTLLKPTSL
jgi:hypothetical protein